MKRSRTQEVPHLIERNRIQSLRLRNQARSARSGHLADLDTFEPGISHASEQPMAGSSGSSSFSQPAASGLHMQSNLAQCLDPRSAYPLHHSTVDETKGSNTGLRQDLEMDFSPNQPNQGLINESGHCSVPAYQDALTPQELSWGQDDHLLFGYQSSLSADTAYGSYDLGLTVNNHTWPLDFIQDSSIGFASRQTYDDSNTLDHPGAIRIEGPKGHYKSNLASSFPSSADCFPDYMPTTQESQYRATPSTSQPTQPSSSPPNLPFGKIPNKNPSSRGSRSGSLSIIREYGHSQHGSPVLSRNGSTKGKRKGPLPTATALAAAQKRKDGSVCIRCRTMKMTVGRCGRILRELADHNLVQRGPSLRGLSSDHEVQILGPTLYPCEFHRHGERRHMQCSL